MRELGGKKKARTGGEAGAVALLGVLVDVARLAQAKGQAVHDAGLHQPFVLADLLADGLSVF